MASKSTTASGRKPAPSRGKAQNTEPKRDRDGSRLSSGILRETGQRRAIRRVVEQANGPLSVQDVLDAAQAEVPGLGIATVYRNLKTMVEEGFLAPIEIPGEPARYEPADKHHHHHFRCRTCDRVFDISGCSSRIDAEVPRGFEVDEHVLVLYGRCPQCATNPKSANSRNRRMRS
jgi:Fur family ferric uptake transcriptional regulator